MLHILIADSDDAYRRSAVDLLNKRGFFVESVRTVPEMRVAIDADRFDLLIVCVLLPGAGDVIELLAEISTEEASPPKLIIVARSGGGEETHFAMIGADTLPPHAVLYDPSKDELLAAVETAIVRRSPQ